MPRPEQTMITLQIDGREVRAVENSMLVDAAKHGDVEIPVFCYEPKLGAPVGACRMCLVEIEGIPKLQTACSTAVKDGMVVHTRSERAQVAQRAVVEFLLINHPLDCPVCDKGGECPLQDITYGWGDGRSRFIEPKRHFRKPLELSPLVAIDRERCILCYRCVRFSQEIAEDNQLILLERGANSFVATFDGHPYVAPFSGNIVELCPVGALTSRPYRFRARPWDIEGSGTVCTLCPSQCNVTLTVRDEHVLRVLGRENDEVDDGWLCDKGRFSYQSVHVEERITAPMIRDGGVLRSVSWERAFQEAASALGRARARSAAIAGGGATNEEGLLLSRLMREALDSPHLDATRGGAVTRAHWRALADPRLAASVPDLEFAHAVLVLDCEPVDDAPILELRIRKGVRRHRTLLALATARPSALDSNAAARLRFHPGAGAAFAAGLAAALRAEPLAPHAAAAGLAEGELVSLAELLRGAGEEIVILYGERMLAGAGAPALLALAEALGVADRPGAGLIGIPDWANGRGLREAGMLADGGPGLSALADGATAGLGAAQLPRAIADGELSALYLLGVDPLRDLPDAAGWEQALEHATTVIAHAAFLSDGLREHASVIFPAESYAEKEGTVTHPDGRVQRLRPAIGHPSEVRSEWRVLAELARRLGVDFAVPTAAALSGELFERVALYGGLRLEELAGRGVRWSARTELAVEQPLDSGTQALPSSTAPRARSGMLRLGTFRSVWAGREVENSPALHFLRREQHAELCPADAVRLGVRDGDAVLVRDEQGELRARVALRAATPPGAVFLEEGIAREGANRLRGPFVTVERVAARNGAASAYAQVSA